MPSFLHRTAKFIIQKYGTDLADICVVLPNRRGGLFLKKSISALIGKTVWSPQIFSIEDFLSDLSEIRLAGNTELLFELYEVHKEIEGKEAQQFEDFITWGQQLLGDFNEIDSYLADPQQLFSYLSEARALSLWNLDLQPLTDFQKRYLRFYNSLYTYYTRLADRLDLKKLSYAGRIFREAAGKAGSVSAGSQWKKIIFAGFNALTKAEEVVFDALVGSGKAELLWDADEYYLNDRKQEAGEFLRNWSEKWKQGEFKWIGDHFKTGSKNITVTGVPYSIGQVKYCGEILSGLPEEEVNSENTAVVLIDEQLLIPLLNSLPENVKALNITMGLSLKQSTYFSLFESIFRMHENRERFRQSVKEGRTRFYFRDVLHFLQHPCVTEMAEGRELDTSFLLEEAVARIRTGGRIFLEWADILPPGAGIFEKGLEFLHPVFENFSTPAEAIDCIRKMILHLRDRLVESMNNANGQERSDGDVISLEFIFAFSNVIHQVESLMKRYDTVRSLKTLHQLFTRICESTTLPFYGEPLKGMQVMGMLETRTLDFRNLIILSVNEDMIPSGRTSNSFIPYDIRRSFGLPTYQHKNAVYAYHFYRLLQRAENIHLAYNSEPDELGGGEKSRFIMQLRQELAASNRDIEMTEGILSAPPVNFAGDEPVRVEKTQEIMVLLKERAKKGLSPTSLNAYRRCPLEFYFSFVAGIEEEKELEETIDVQILGQAVHDVLNHLYKPYLNRPLDPADFDRMLPLIASLADKAFEKTFTPSGLAYGENLLMVNVANIMVRNFLAEEKKSLAEYRRNGGSLTVRLLEQQLYRIISFPTGEEIFEIKLKGFVDRVDRLDGTTRIIDYKTGKVDKKDMELSDWNDLAADPSKEKCFQLLMYAYLLDKNVPETALPVEAGIIPLRKVRTGFMPVAIPGDSASGGRTIDENVLLNFEEVLFGILGELFDKKVPFTQAEDPDTCSRCSYTILCGR